MANIFRNFFDWLWGRRTEEEVWTEDEEERTEEESPDPEAESEPEQEGVTPEVEVPETEAPSAESEEKEGLKGEDTPVIPPVPLPVSPVAPETPSPPDPEKQVETPPASPPAPEIPTSYPPDEILAPEKVYPQLRVNPVEAASEPQPEFPAMDTIWVDLVRYSEGAHDTLGRLSIGDTFFCFTLEGPADPAAGDAGCLPTGTYDLALRKAGGKHATYRHRYREMHQGMLWVQGSDRFPYAQIHEGNRQTDVPGSIIVGEQPLREHETQTKREIWYSVQAYQELYPVLSRHLVMGGEVKLRISHR